MGRYATKADREERKRELRAAIRATGANDRYIDPLFGDMERDDGGMVARSDDPAMRWEFLKLPNEAQLNGPFGRTYNETRTLNKKARRALLDSRIPHHWIFSNGLFVASFTLDEKTHSH